MRVLLALGGALALAGCTSGERVTLLSPVQADKIRNNDVGALVVKHGDDETIVDSANQQAGLRGTRPPRLRQLDRLDPVHGEVIGGLPPEVIEEVFKFGNDQDELTGAQLELLLARMPMHLDRPDPQIEIAAYTDAPGAEDYNYDLSRRRANNVAQQVRELGFTVDDEDIIPKGEYAAARTPQGQRGESDENFRVVVIVVR